jgi:hypothetical protein
MNSVGWEGGNIRFDYHFTSQDAERMRAGAGKLIDLGPGSDCGLRRRYAKKGYPSGSLSLLCPAQSVAGLARS